VIVFGEDWSSSTCFWRVVGEDDLCLVTSLFLFKTGLPLVCLQG
jgi:hypothetical protein